MSRLAHAVLIIAVLLGLSPAPGLAQATPEPATTTGSLLDVLIYRSMFPGEEGFMLVGRNVAQPGMRGTYFHPDEKGVVAIVVEDGTLTYQIDQPGGRILRQANSANPVEEPAPAGSPFMLESGDALVYPAQKRIESNESDAPVTFLFAVILEPVPPPPPDPSDIGEVETTILARYDAPWIALPAGPVALTLDRANVAGGETLAADVGNMQTVSQESGEPGALLIGGDGTAINLSDEIAEALVLTVAPTGSPAASPAATPASGVAAAGATEITVERVARVSLLHEAMPAEDASFDAWFSFWGPGESIEFPSYAPQVNIAADVVLVGEQVSHSEGRMQLQRDGTMEEITPGEEVMLGPGDAVVYVENSAAQGLRNPGEVPAESISFGVFVGSTAITNADWEQSGVASGDVAVTVDRLTLSPGASLDPLRPDLAQPTLFAVSAGELQLDVISTTDPTVPEATLQFLPGQLIPFRTLPEEMQFVLHNAGSEPLTLIQLTLAQEDAEAGEGTPVP
jgi:mannose-6-phosphate isomerase-like protein (cupin superfamily)